MKDKRQLQIRPHFKNDDYDASSDWAFAFELLIPKEFGEYLSGQVEKEKRLPMVDRKAKELLTNSPAGVDLAD